MAEAVATVVASRVAVPAAVAEDATGAEAHLRKPHITRQQNGKSFHMRSTIASERNATRKESKAAQSVPFLR